MSTTQKDFIRKKINLEPQRLLLYSVLLIVFQQRGSLLLEQSWLPVQTMATCLLVDDGSTGCWGLIPWLIPWWCRRGCRLLVFGCSTNADRGMARERAPWCGQPHWIGESNEDDTERPQCTFHPVSNILETVWTRLTVMKQSSFLLSISLPYHHFVKVTSYLIRMKLIWNTPSVTE